jgi:hypothetical protein
MFLPHWSVFVEHNFLGFGTNSSHSSVVACGGACILSGKADLQNVLVGLNSKFQSYVARTVWSPLQSKPNPEHSLLGVFHCRVRHAAEMKFPRLPNINSSETQP